MNEYKIVRSRRWSRELWVGRKKSVTTVFFSLPVNFPQSHSGWPTKVIHKIYLFYVKSNLDFSSYIQKFLYLDIQNLRIPNTFNLFFFPTDLTNPLWLPSATWIWNKTFHPFCSPFASLSSRLVPSSSSFRITILMVHKNLPSDPTWKFLHLV